VGDRRSLPARAAGRAWHAAEQAVEALLERRLGVDSGGTVYLEETGDADAERVWHVPSDWLALRRALRRLRPGPQDVLADIGAGRGRGVLVAAGLPFGRVIGVELSAPLAAAARRNVERARPRLACRDVELVTTDATTWPVPDDLTVAYMYSPLLGGAFEAVLANLLASVDRRPRLLRLVYAFPFEHRRVLATGRAEVIDASPGSAFGLSRTGPDTLLTYALRPSRPAPEVEAAIARARRPLGRARAWRDPLHDPGMVLHREGEARRPGDT
jgi:SAM-dependent methyltransferase